MASGTANGGWTSNNFRVQVEWTRTAINLSDNTSTIHFELFIQSNSGLNFETWQSRNGNLSIAGTNWAFTWQPLVVAANSRTRAASITRTFTHGNNGQNPINITLVGSPVITIGQLSGIFVPAMSMNASITIPQIRFGTDTANRVRITAAGTTTTWRGLESASIIIGSSLKYKEFIRPIRGAKSIYMDSSTNNEVGLDVINNLNVISFNYKNNNENHLGVIAENSIDVIDINCNGVHLPKVVFNSIIATQQLSEESDKIDKVNKNTSTKINKIESLIQKINKELEVNTHE